MSDCRNWYMGQAPHTAGQWAQDRREECYEADFPLPTNWMLPPEQPAERTDDDDDSVVEKRSRGDPDE